VKRGFQAPEGEEITQNILVLESKDPEVLLPELLPYLCSTNAFFAHAIDTSEGSLFPNANWKAIQQFEFSLPPLKEQRRITGVLKATNEAANATCEMHQSSLRVLKSLSEHYFPSLPQVSSSDEAICAIADCSDEIFLGLTSKVDYVESGGVPLVRACNFSSGVLDLSGAKTISVAQHRELTKKRRAERNDILVSKSGNLGTCVMVQTDEEFSIYESVIVVKVEPDLVDPHFMLWQLRSPRIQNNLARRTVGSAVKHINLKSFQKLPVWIPPISLQRSISKELQEFEREVGIIRQRGAEMKTLASLVLQEVLL
jgi:type I restriction enzyme S subunit